jgi:predicted nucleic acid-binding protein
LALIESSAALVLSAQVAREYLVVASRPVEVNGLGLSLSAALLNLAEFRRVARVLPEERPTLRALLTLLRSHPCSGKAIHDALLVATMRVHGVSTLATSNVAHFDRYRDLIRVVAPG